MSDETTAEDGPRIGPAGPLPEEMWRDAGLRPGVVNVKMALEARAMMGEPMEGFDLARCDLEDVNLVNHGSAEGHKLINADLYRANMRYAHCFRVDFSGSSLMKADFRNANLHCANLTDCNLLGTMFQGAQLEHVIWGDTVLQERQALAANDPELRGEYLQQAEEVYRNLRKSAEGEGLFETAGYFFQREMVMRRLQMPPLSFSRLVSKIVDLFCGYGELPGRVVGFSLLLIFAFSLMYFYTGLNFSGDALGYNAQASFGENLNTFFSSLYFSVVTFTTLGYGDLAPVGAARALAAIEAFLGSFTLALFVVVFVKKMTR